MSKLKASRALWITIQLLLPGLHGCVLPQDTASLLEDSASLPSEEALAEARARAVAPTPPPSTCLTVEGDYTRITWSENGTWNCTGEGRGFQIRDTTSDAWTDVSYPAVPYQHIEMSCDGLSEQLWDIDSSPGSVTAADLSDASLAVAQHVLTAGDLSLEKTETWALDGRAVYIEMRVTNNGDAAATGCVLRHSVDPDQDEGVYPLQKTYNDVVQVGDLGGPDWVQAVGYATGTTVGYGVCEAANQEVGVTNHTLGSTLAFTDPNGNLWNKFVNFRQTLSDLAPGASETFGFVFAWGTDADAAADAYLAMAEDACRGWQEECNGLDDDGDGLVDEDFDLDGDGVARCCADEPALVIPDGTRTKVYTITDNGAGGFSRSEQPAMEADEAVYLMALGDLDGDGTMDLDARGTTSGTVYRASCNGGEWQTTTHGTVPVVVQGGGDLDDDGLVDLLGWNLASSPLSGSGAGYTAHRAASGEYELETGTFDVSSFVGIWGAAKVYNALDLNGDGYEDTVALTYSSGGASTSNVYRLDGDGTGSFGALTAIGSVKGQPQNQGDLGDVDGDGHVDWVGGPDDDGDRGSVQIMFGHGDGSFSTPKELVDVWTLSGGTGVVPGMGRSHLYDWDGDGFLDLFTGHIVSSMFTGKLLYHRGLSGGTFAPAVEVVPSSTLSGASFLAPLQTD